MKRTSVIWYILGALVLIGLGFVVGYVLNGGFMRAAALRGAAIGPMGRGMMPGGFFFAPRFGLGALILAYLCLGPLAGFVALFLVLTRRPAAVVAPVAAPVVRTEPVAVVEPPTPVGEPQPETPDKK